MEKVIPIWRSFPGEGFTPPEIYERVRGRNSFLLESVQGLRQNGASDTGRYSFIGFEPYLIFKTKGADIEIEERGASRFEKGNPVKRLKEIIDGFSLEGESSLPPFSGGASGYFSYEVRHLFEELPANAPDDIRIPDIYFVFIDRVIAFDHRDKKIFIICNVRPGGHGKTEAEEELRRVEGKIFREKGAFRKNGAPSLGDKIESNFTIDEFKSMVLRAKEYIKCGDIYQANLSQRLRTSIQGDPWELYKILRKINPSPFAAHLDFDGVKIVSSSPERLLLVRGDRVETRPIAGTRPRGRDTSEDKMLSRGLLFSPKERAEHIMLVDLERNDLGRVCEYGTVNVNELMAIENYSHVIHIVSNVRGRLRRGMDRFSALAACFPGGTITGTPKIRSMEIIDELEKVSRSIYTGSIGYLNYGGEMDLNIVIRTFVIKGKSLYVQVGAGIVADSNPEREYFETIHKAEALVETVRKAGPLK